MTHRIARPAVLVLAIATLVAALAACGREGSDIPAAAPPAAAVAPASETAPAAEAAANNKTADFPTLKLQTVEGADYDLAAHRGKWVVINFWATWCGPCLKEMPELSALDAMREHVEVLGLAYEDITPSDMRAFLRDHPVVYPVAIVDVYAPPADFATPRGLPSTYLLDPQGKVVKKFTGGVTAAGIEEAIAANGGPAVAAAGHAAQAHRAGAH